MSASLTHYLARRSAARLSQSFDSARTANNVYSRKLRIKELSAHAAESLRQSQMQTGDKRQFCIDLAAYLNFRAGQHAEALRLAKVVYRQKPLNPPAKTPCANT